MTAAQRRKINRQNASKSTGPKTQMGRDRARRNALKHGLCASKLALPGEEPLTLKIQRDDWIDTLQPQTPAEVTLVDEAVRADLRLKRCAQAEQARLEWEVVSAPARWLEAREERLVPLTALLTTDPATATRRLNARFGHGLPLAARAAGRVAERTPSSTGPASSAPRRSPTPCAGLAATSSSRGPGRCSATRSASGTRRSRPS